MALSYKNTVPSHPLSEAPLGARVRISSRAKQMHKVIGRDLFGMILLQGDNGEQISMHPESRAYFMTGIERITAMLELWDHYSPDQKDQDLPGWMK